MHARRCTFTFYKWQVDWYTFPMKIEWGKKSLDSWRHLWLVRAISALCVLYIHLHLPYHTHTHTRIIIIPVYTVYIAHLCTSQVANQWIDWLQYARIISIIQCTNIDDWWDVDIQMWRLSLIMCGRARTRRAIKNRPSWSHEYHQRSFHTCDDIPMMASRNHTFNKFRGL